MNVLHAALDRALAFPPEYRAGLSNHLPMALHALHELGADAARLESFARGYATRFVDAAPPARFTPGPDWRNARGRIEAYDALRAHFASRVQSAGRDVALRESLPALWPGMAAAALHGLIRTSHAAQAGHDGELAGALAYWAARWQPLPEPAPASVPMALDDWIEALTEHARHWRSAAPLISGRIAEVAGTDAYRRLGGALRIDAETPAALWRHAAACYARTGNFTILHVVTGCRAIHALAPWIDAPHDPWRHAVPAVAAAILASGLGPAGPGTPAHARWPDVAARAIASDDDHVIKLVHAAQDGERRVGGAAFLAAAARATG